MIIAAMLAWAHEEIRTVVEPLQRAELPDAISERRWASIHLVVEQHETLKAQCPGRGAEASIPDSLVAWPFSQSRARWNSRERTARFGAALQTVDSLVRRGLAVQVFAIDVQRTRDLVCGASDRSIEEDPMVDLSEEVQRPSNKKE